MQYFLAFSGYSSKAPFDPSMMVHFRKRLSDEDLRKINELIVQRGKEMLVEAVAARVDDSDKPDDQDGDGGAQLSLDSMIKPANWPEGMNWGTISLDASCAPADITYPTDLKLLNEARNGTEKIIDDLCHQSTGFGRHRPHYNREKARFSFLTIAKQKKPRLRKLKAAVRKQLNYLQRNLEAIDALIAAGASLSALKQHWWQKRLACSELARQQAILLESNSRSIPHRFAHLVQKQVRPIVRGKARAAVEFGAKISITVENGFPFLHRISWDAYNEGGDLIAQAEKYKKDNGCYPERICADRIYINRENRHFCMRNGIRLSGKPLGRPPKNPDLNAARKQQLSADLRRRNEVEGSFGAGKRKYSLDRIMAKLKHGTETTISMAFIVMCSEKVLRLLRLFFVLILGWLLGLYSLQDDDSEGCHSLSGQSHDLLLAV